MLGVRTVGTTISLYQNGAVIASVNDSTYNRAGNIGVEVKGGNTFDNFGGGTLP